MLEGDEGAIRMPEYGVPPKFHRLGQRAYILNELFEAPGAFRYCC